jgi:hypothetical protein
MLDYVPNDPLVFREALARACGIEQSARSASTVVVRQAGDRAATAARADPALAAGAVVSSATISRLRGQLPRLDRPAGSEEWVAAARQLGMLLQTEWEGPAAGEAEQARAGLARQAVPEVLVRSGRLISRLFADEAPDAAVFAAELAGIDEIEAGLRLLRAEDERRLVRALGEATIGQVLRRAARVMVAYADSRDPLARFDVVAMLVHAEALGGLVGRLVELTAGRSGDEHDPVLGFTHEALTEFLDGIGALIGVSEHDLTEALASTVPVDVGEFVRNLKQIRLIWRFLTHLETDIFRDRLADLSRRIYVLFSELTATMASSTDISPTIQEQMTALYEMAEDQGWHELAGRLLGPLRCSALTPETTLRAPARPPTVRP